MAPIDPSEQRINALLQFSQNTEAAIEDVLAGLSNTSGWRNSIIMPSAQSTTLANGQPLSSFIAGQTGWTGNGDLSLGINNTGSNMTAQTLGINQSGSMQTQFAGIYDMNIGNTMSLGLPTSATASGSTPEQIYTAAGSKCGYKIVDKKLKFYDADGKTEITETQFKDKAGSDALADAKKKLEDSNKAQS